jgi:hypothetical protein
MRVLVRHATQIDSIRLCQVIITSFSGRIAAIKTGWVLWVDRVGHAALRQLQWVNCVGI